MYTYPTVDDFKSYFARDFPYGRNVNESITDSDIQKAINQVPYKINESLFCDQGEFDIGFLNLSAHFLCIDIQSSSQGISGKYEWLLGSKSVGSVSVSQSIPNSILEDPVLAMYSKTNYGANYIMMVYPKLIGRMFSVEGATTA